MAFEQAIPLHAALDLTDRDDRGGTNGSQVTTRLIRAGLGSGSLVNAIEFASLSQPYARPTTRCFGWAVRLRAQ